MKNNTKFIKGLVILCLCTSSAFSLASNGTPKASENSCLIAGEITLYGNKVNVKDCMKLNGVSIDKVEEICEKTLKSASFGKKGLNLTYSANCPASSQGVCLGLKYEGADMDAYYYNRDKSILPAMASGCKSQGGNWK
ncbi:hypothetical protein ACJJIL_12575 [Microbulbifer sp. EKSA005]|uniref:hypothetical protein n=1 Tax=Microbulbifer sp. EKSA005 TaxID=3243364 RepID=UPI00404280B9